MTIDITDLINNSGEQFPENLEAFKKKFPHLFKTATIVPSRIAPNPEKEEKPSETNQEGTEADANKGS